MGNTISWVYLDPNLTPPAPPVPPPTLIVENNQEEPKLELSADDPSTDSSTDSSSASGASVPEKTKKNKRFRRKNTETLENNVETSKEVIVIGDNSQSQSQSLSQEGNPMALRASDLSLKELILASNIVTQKIAKLTVNLRYNTIIEEYNHDKDEKRPFTGSSWTLFKLLFLSANEKKIKEIIKFSKETIAELRDLETLRKKNIASFIPDGIQLARSTHVKIDILFSFSYRRTGLADVYEVTRERPKALEVLYHADLMGKMGLDFYMKWAHVLDKFIVENKDSPSIIVDNDPEIIDLYDDMIGSFPSVWKSVLIGMKNKSALTNLKPNINPNDEYSNSIQLNFNSNVSHKTYNNSGYDQYFV